MRPLNKAAHLLIARQRTVTPGNKKTAIGKDSFCVPPARGEKEEARGSYIWLDPRLHRRTDRQRLNLKERADGFTNSRVSQSLSKAGHDVQRTGIQRQQSQLARGETGNRHLKADTYREDLRSGHDDLSFAREEQETTIGRPIAWSRDLLSANSSHSDYAPCRRVRQCTSGRKAAT
jgi:hypothetical protein